MTTTTTSRSMAVKTTYVPPTREDSTAHRRMAMPDRRSSRTSLARSLSIESRQLDDRTDEGKPTDDADDDVEPLNANVGTARARWTRDLRPG
jgi:hypothetical protein